MSKGKKIKISRIVFANFLIMLALVIVGSAIYLNQYYPAEADVEKYMTDTNTVKIKKQDYGYFFDGPSEDMALIFYQGAKVETKAYAPVLEQLAENGVDCFLVEMPFNIAFFDMNKAEEVVSRYSYKHWYMMGHSLGGVAASNYCAKNENQIDGMIFLASYPTENLSDTSVRVLSILGSEDKVLNRERFEQAKELMPKKYQEINIQGGNHAGFGMYGKQKGDGESSISKEEQWKQTLDAIRSFIGNEE